MCDDFTREQEDTALAAKGLSRREFAALGSAAAIAACAPSEIGAQSDAGEDEEMLLEAGGLVEGNVTVPTPDGEMDAFFVYPAAYPKPAVIMWPDVAGLREAYHQMARRLAGQGYAVIAVNPYYRGAKAPVLGSFMEWRTDEGRATIRPLRAALSSRAVMRDATALVTWLDEQDVVDSDRGIGSAGYCMGGPFTVYSTAAQPDRVKAAASFHGGGLVRDDADSPHKLLATTQASYLFAIANNDDDRSPEDKTALRAAANAAGRPAEVEVYPAPHGWCTIDSPVHDPEQADKAWYAMLGMFETAL